MVFTESYLDDLKKLASMPLLERLRGKRVFVTGATGLIGSCLVDALVFLDAFMGLGMRVCAGCRVPEAGKERFSAWPTSCVEVAAYDALGKDQPQCNDSDYVFHCASNAHPVAYSAQPVETSLVNIIGLDGLLRVLATRGSGKLLFVSSSEVYGRYLGDSLYTEEQCGFVDMSDPRSCYPMSKRMCENLCACYADEYGIDYTIVRPGHVYGPTGKASDSRAHAQFAARAAKGLNIELKSAGMQFRSYCYVIDCVSAILFAMLNGESGEAYNIANPRSDVFLRQVAESFALAAGVEVRYAELSPDELRGGNRMERSALDSSKLRELGWQPETDILEGARKTVEMLRAQ